MGLHKEKKKQPVIKLGLFLKSHKDILPTTCRYLNTTEFFINKKFIVTLEQHYKRLLLQGQLNQEFQFSP